MDVNHPRMTWMEVAILLVPGMTPAECDDILPDILIHHQHVAFRMQTHLSLTCSNITEAVWMSARMLSMSPEKARLGAREFSEHLKRCQLNISNTTAYERHWLGDIAMMEQLHAFNLGSSSPTVAPQRCIQTGVLLPG